MPQIADWLKGLGMAEYAERFAEKHIDIGVLRDLTDQDLKDLGVVSIGHGREMLRAISELAEAICEAVIRPNIRFVATSGIQAESDRDSRDRDPRHWSNGRPCRRSAQAHLGAWRLYGGRFHPPRGSQAPSATRSVGCAYANAKQAVMSALVETDALSSKTSWVAVLPIRPRPPS
jgi:hypothetical protein